MTYCLAWALRQAADAIIREDQDCQASLFAYAMGEVEKAITMITSFTLSSS